jgi:hypothetical protein
VGEGLLSTLFDEIVYGREVFKDTYGFECGTRRLSVPGLIVHERILVSHSTLEFLSALSHGKFGMITGRPKIPTIHTLGQIFEKWFCNPEICMFTGDHILDIEEVKPSPKPMLKLAEKLPDKKSSILYVGDSSEDLLMARSANHMLNERICFASVASSRAKLKYFEREGDSECIVSNVNELVPAIREGCSWNELPDQLQERF